MQETNANTLFSSGGSLSRKSSQKTYGRRGRAYAAVKEENARDEGDVERREDHALDTRFHGQTRISNSESASHSGVSAYMDDTESLRLLNSTENQAPSKKRSRLVVDSRLETAPLAALSDMNTGAKRQRVGANDVVVARPQSGSTKTLTRPVMTPSSDLSDLPSESESDDTDVEGTPKAVQPQPAHLYRNVEQKATKQRDSQLTAHQMNGKAGRAKASAPITAPTSTTFLPAISSSTDNSNGVQPMKLPARKKTRMLSRAESFGRNEAQKDQLEAASVGAAGKVDHAVSSERKDFGSSASCGQTVDTVPTTPRRSLVRSSTLASLDTSPSKQRSALARTNSMPLSPIKNSIILSAQIPEPTRSFGVSSNGIPARRTYGKVQRVNSQVNESVSRPPPVTGQTSAQLSPIPQSSVGHSEAALSSPSRPLLEPRESYADLVKRLEMDDDEESQDREEMDGSMDYLRNAQSLAELRSKGENRKFMDDLTWLVDGLSDNILSVRRSSAIDVLNKMSDPGWFDRLRICSQVEEIYTRLSVGHRISTDIGYDLAFLEYLAYVARVPNAMTAILGNHRDSVIIFALHVLRTPSVTFNVTVTSNKRKSSPALKAVSTLRIPLNLTDGQNDPLSADAMALIVIEAATEHDMAGNLEPSEVSMQEQICTSIAEALRHYLQMLPERIELFEKGLNLFPEGTDMDFAFIAEAIEALSMIRNSSPTGRAKLESLHSGLATDLSNLLLVMQFVEVPLVGEKEDLVCQLLVAPTLSSKSWSLAILKSVAPAAMVFRLLVSSGCLSAASEATDSGRKSDDLAAEESHVVVNNQDREVSVPLGLLYNLMDVAEDNGEALLLQTELSINCSCTPLCLRQCRCNDRKIGVNLLCDVFDRQQDKRIDDPSAAFLAGYLTLLFTRVLERQTCKDAILTFIQGSSHQEKLAVLQDCLRQFADVYESAQLRLNEAEGGSNANEEDAIQRTIKTGLRILQSISLL